VPPRTCLAWRPVVDAPERSCVRLMTGACRSPGARAASRGNACLLMGSATGLRNVSKLTMPIKPQAARAVWDERFTHETEPAEHDRDRLAAIVALLPDGISRLVDVGCGDGRITNALLSRASTVIGYDISPVGLSRVRGKRVAGHIGALPFQDASFDLVLCAEVLEHLDGSLLTRVVTELCRVSKEYVLITTPHAEDRKAGLVQCSVCYTVFHASYHVRSFTLSDLDGLFSRLNLRRLHSLNSGSGRFNSATLMTLAQGLAGYYAAARPGLVCPLCGRSDVSLRKARERVVSAAAVGLNRILGYVLPRRPLNFVVLYRKSHI
jgi:SAM-dependent methyltransferase